MTAIIAMPKYTERSWGKKGLGSVVRYKIDRGAVWWEGVVKEGEGKEGNARV